MVKLEREATESQIFEVIRDWVELLSQDKYEEAFEMFRYHSTEYWSAELIRTVIKNYGFIEPREDGVTFKVTSLKENLTGQPFNEVQWWDDDPNRPAEYIGEIAFTLPLNNEWSDVTALFRIVEVDNVIVLELDDIHVL